jgi:hypothetical protein
MIRAGVLLLTLTPILSYAQIGAPQLGLIPDGASLRPVAGIPASAVVGSPLTFTRNLSQVVTAPSQSFALAVDADSGEVLLVNSVTNVATPIPNVAPKPDRILLSPRGSAAVLWYSAVHQALILSGLPGNPSLRDLDLSFAASDPTALAITDDGVTLAGSWSGIVYQFGPNGPAALPVTNSIPALAYAPGSSDLALVSATSATLWNAAGTSVLATFVNPISPVAAALDSRRSIVADASGAIITLDLASSSLSTLDCQCTPQGLFLMSRSVYRLTGLSQGAFKLFDADRNAIWFAPLALPAQVSGDGQ